MGCNGQLCNKIFQKFVCGYFRGNVDFRLFNTIIRTQYRVNITTNIVQSIYMPILSGMP